MSSFIPFSALIASNASEKWEFLLYWDDYTNFMNHPEKVTLFPVFSSQHWLHDILGTVGLNVWEPVGQVLKAGLCDLVGLDGRNLRLASLAFHTLNAWLLSEWLRLLFSQERCGRMAVSRRVALLVALLFWVHPLNIEVVGWLSAQNYVFSMTFGLLMMIEIEKNGTSSGSSSSSSRSIIVVVLFLLGVFSKAPAVTLAPLALARMTHLWWEKRSRDNDTQGQGQGKKEGTKGKRDATASTGTSPTTTTTIMQLVLPCLHLCTATVGAVYCAHHFNGSSEQQYPEASLPSYAVGAALRAAMTLAHFLRRVVFPDDLRAHYQFPRHSELQAIYHLVDDSSSSSSLSSPDGVGAFDAAIDPSAVMALAFMLAVTAFFAGLARDPHTVVASYSWLSFLACWSPTMGVLQHGDGSQFGANRYMYFPTAFGLAPLVAMLFQRAVVAMSSSSSSSSSSSKDGKGRGGYPPLCAAVILASIGFSYVGNHVLLTWRSDATLLQSCLNADSTDLVCTKFAGEYMGLHKREEALATSYRRREYEVISSSVVHGVSFNDMLYLGHIHLLLREVQPACEVFKKVYARGLPPKGPRGQATNNYVMAHVNVVLCLVQEGELEQAGLEMARLPPMEAMQRDLRPRVLRSAAKSIGSVRDYLDPRSPAFKQPFYSEFLF